MFKKNRKPPFTPFTFNKLIYRMLNKKVKGEGLKTLFIYGKRLRIYTIVVFSFVRTFAP